MLKNSLICCQVDLVSNSFSRVVNSVIKLLSWLLIMIPVAIAGYYSYCVSVDIPYFDEWTLVPFVEKWWAGNGHWQDFFQPYPAHGVSYIIPFGKAIALLGVKFTHWDVRFEIAVGFCMLLATSFVFIKYARRVGCLTSNLSSISLLLPIMLLLFSLRQYESLIGPWGGTFFSVAFFVMVTAYLISQSTSKLWLIMAMICGVMASLTFPNGMIIWPLGLAALIVQSRWRESVYWFLIGGCFLGLLFGCCYEYLPYDRSNVTWLLILLRFLCVLGGIFSMDKSIVTGGSAGTTGQQDIVIAVIVGFGIFLLSIFLLWIIRKELKSFLMPVIGALYSLGSCMMIAYGRADFGLEQTFASRYTTEPLLLVASLLIIIAQLKIKGLKFLRVESCVISLIVISSLYSTFTESIMMPHRHNYIQGWANKVLDYHHDKANLQNPHFTQDQMYSYVSILERMKMSVFREHSMDFKIINWGPKSTELGLVPNKQADGNMGIWIEVSSTQWFGDAQVIFNGDIAKSISIQDKLITLAIEPAQLETLGNKKIYIKQVRTGKLFYVGAFTVSGKKNLNHSFLRS